MSVEAKLLPGHAKRISFQGWTWDPLPIKTIRRQIARAIVEGDMVGEMHIPDSAVSRVVADAMRTTLTEGDEYGSTINVSFPWQWTHQPTTPTAHIHGDVIDPMTIHIRLPFGKVDDNYDPFRCDPILKVNLRELIDDALDSWTELEAKGRLWVSEESLQEKEAFVAALEAEAKRARDLLTNALIVDDMGDPVEDK